jgi:Ca2+-binding RTX toxin-like protein
LEWDGSTAHADFESDIDEFNSAVWIKLDAVVGQTYDFTAHSLGNGPRDTSFEIYNADGNLVLSETSDVAIGAHAVLTASTTAPVYVKLFMPSGLPGEVNLDVSTSDLTDHYLSPVNDTYTGTFGERILGYYGDDVLVVNNASEASGGAGNDTIYCNTTQDAVWGDQGDDSFLIDGGNDTIFGGAGNDSVGTRLNFGGNVQVFGGSGHDVLDLFHAATAIIYGGDQADSISGSNGSDTIHGGSGGDEIFGNGGTNFIFGDSGNDIIDGGANSESIDGGTGNDTISGGGGGDTIVGDAGNDQLVGGSVGDDFTGGAGADVMTGDGGADLFIFQKTSDSTAAKSGRDTITDFDPVHYAMDLHAIDANTGIAGNQAFHFIGTQSFHHEAGDLRYAQSGGNTYVYGDVDGDNKSDFSVELTGALTLKAINFIL